MGLYRKQKMSAIIDEALQAKCWRFINHPDFVQYGPRSTDGDWEGFTVGLQKPDQQAPVKRTCSGFSHESFAGAVIKAVKKWKG